MAGDPSLNQVVSKTFEIGLRGNNSDLKWTAVVFNTQNTDDIQFVANTTSGLGYFKNFGKTQRRGFEGSLAKKFDKLSLRGNFTFLDATYQSPEAILSENNGSGAESTIYFTGERQTTNYTDTINTINIKKGDKMPGIPESTLKLFADYDVNDKFNLGLSTYTVTSQYKRGDENNQDSRGKLAGYTTLNIHSSYKLHSEWTLFAKVNNVFDKQYATSGILGATVYGSDGVPTVSGVTQTSVSETFVSPGAPRAAWVGIRYEFGGKKSSGDLDKD
jgi:outer membrane receptor protein involved in Fe transport